MLVSENDKSCDFGHGMRSAFSIAYWYRFQIDRQCYTHTAHSTHSPEWLENASITRHRVDTCLAFHAPLSFRLFGFEFEFVFGARSVIYILLLLRLKIHARRGDVMITIFLSFVRFLFKLNYVNWIMYVPVEYVRLNNMIVSRCALTAQYVKSELYCTFIQSSFSSNCLCAGEGVTVLYARTRFASFSRRRVPVTVTDAPAIRQSIFWRWIELALKTKKLWIGFLLKSCQSRLKTSSDTRDSTEVSRPTVETKIALSNFDYTYLFRWSSEWSKNVYSKEMSSFEHNAPSSVFVCTKPAPAPLSFYFYCRRRTTASTELQLKKNNVTQ